MRVLLDYEYDEVVEESAVYIVVFEDSKKYLHFSATDNDILSNPGNFRIKHCTEVVNATIPSVTAKDLNDGIERLLREISEVSGEITAKGPQEKVIMQCKTIHSQFHLTSASDELYDTVKEMLQQLTDAFRQPTFELEVVLEKVSSRMKEQLQAFTPSVSVNIVNEKREEYIQQIVQQLQNSAQLTEDLTSGERPSLDDVSRYINPSPYQPLKNRSR